MEDLELSNLKESNYVRIAQSKNNYWVDFSRNKLYGNYIEKFGYNFNIIISSDARLDEEYYIIPFSVISEIFNDEYLANDNRNSNGRRWVGNIKNHLLKFSNCDKKINVKDYYSNRFELQDYSKAEVANDYAIENIKREVNVRLKQSKFRTEVLANFNNKCCISGISEFDLLLASHIIPWADKKETRLDPLNGLCLSALYDKLFDKGYFTLNDNNTILTAKYSLNYSDSLNEILSSIDGKKITIPIRPLNTQYLKYHRENIFIDRN